jgi:hypothetical protein
MKVEEVVKDVEAKVEVVKEVVAAVEAKKEVFI